MIVRSSASSTGAMLAVIMALAVVAIAAPNVTYAPPFVPKTYFSTDLLNSPIGSKLITSKRIESLYISTFNDTSTRFILSYRIAASTSSKISINIIQFGAWSHLVSTKESLSCSLVYEANSSTFAFLQFIEKQASLKLYANISLASLRAFLPAANSSSDQNAIASNFLLGAECNIGQLFGTLYRISSTGDTLTLVGVDQNWAIQASTESFFYAVSNNALYRYNQTLNQYDKAYSFSSFAKYFIFEYQGRVVVSASNVIANSTVGNATTYRVNQTIYLLVDAPSGLKLIERIDVEGFSSLSYIMVFTSMRLTKFAYEYTPVGNSSSVMVVKSVDYFRSKVITLTWKDFARFSQTRQAATYAEIAITDTFLVVRNGTAFAKNFSLIGVEDAYQFVANQIILFSYTNLVGHANLTVWSRMVVDP